MYDWNYIDDCISGLMLAGEQGKSDSVYYIGSRTRRPLKEIVSELRDILAPMYINFIVILVTWQRLILRMLYLLQRTG